MPGSPIARCPVRCAPCLAPPCPHSSHVPPAGSNGGPVPPRWPRPLPQPMGERDARPAPARAPAPILTAIAAPPQRRLPPPPPGIASRSRRSRHDRCGRILRQGFPCRRGGGRHLQDRRRPHREGQAAAAGERRRPGPSQGRRKGRGGGGGGPGARGERR